MDPASLTAVLAILAGLVVFALLITAAVLILRDTVRQRGLWGIPLTTLACRHCNAPVPIVRVPRNSRQFWWGGWTCPECGLELDKWGEPIPNQTGPAKWRMPLDDPRRPPGPTDERIAPPNNDVQPS